MNNAIKEYTIGDKVLRIFSDDNPESPREWDNLGVIVAWHNRYSFSDKITKTGNASIDNCFKSNEDFQEWLKDHKAVVLPLYLYDHSQQALSTQSFVGRAVHAEWDSGQVGWIYCTYEAIKKEYGVKKVTSKLIEKAKGILVTEIKIYNQYIQGDIYGYTLSKINTCDTCKNVSEDVEDSCWGFFGSDWKTNGILDNLPEDFKKLVEKE